MFVGLLAARNAGIEVSDEVIDKAIAYFTSMTSSAGQVAYSGGFGGFDESLAHISIATLAYSVAGAKICRSSRPRSNTLCSGWKRPRSRTIWNTRRYYQSQALFQGDVEAWEKWNKLLVRQLKTSQAADGSFSSQFGVTAGTSLSLLALALNYRFLPIYER